jgi:hypothetical protein
MVKLNQFNLVPQDIVTLVSVKLDYSSNLNLESLGLELNWKELFKSSFQLDDKKFGVVEKLIRDHFNIYIKLIKRDGDIKHFDPPERIILDVNMWKNLYDMFYYKNCEFSDFLCRVNCYENDPIFYNKMMNSDYINLTKIKGWDNSGSSEVRYLGYNFINMCIWGYYINWRVF